MNNLRIVNIIPDSIVSLIGDRDHHLYQVLSVIHSTYDNYVLLSLEDQCIRFCSFDDIRLEQAVCTNFVCDANGNEVRIEKTAG